MGIGHLGKRIAKSEAFKSALRAGYARYINLVLRTTRWRRVGFEAFDRDIAEGIPRVLCSWHSRLTLTPFCRDWSDHAFAVMASDHHDAQIATANLANWGIETVALKTSGDNRAAMREAVKLLRRGVSLGLTPDGPLGPREVVKPGALGIAGLAGVRVAPVTFSVSRSLRLRTWDGLILPLPFGRGIFAMSEGFVPPARMTAEEMEAACARLGREITELTEATDRMMAEETGRAKK